MFTLVQKNKRLIQVLIILLIIPFAFFGLEAYTRATRGTDVATVDGEGITPREFEEALRAQQDRLRAAFGGQVDVAALDTPEMREAIVEALVAERLVATAAVKSRLLVSDDTLRRVIMAMPAFQRDGRFSKPDYEALLRAQGLTEAQFEARLRYDLSVGQLRQAVADTAIASRTVAARFAALENEQRELSESLVPAGLYLDKVKLEPDQTKAYYEANKAAFMTPERVRVEYLVLSAAALGKDIAVSPEELQKAYDAAGAKYRVGEQRRASHILFQLPADADAAARAEVRKKAEAVLAELKKSPERFAELARQHSQDTGSAASGGDLGLFGRGMMVKPFEEVAFALKADETSGIVETEFGLHIIRVTEVQPERARPLEEVRAELTEALQREKGRRRFAEIAEAFANQVYEQADALKPVAERFKLEIGRSDWITRAPRPEYGVLSHPRLLAAVFSPDALKERRNTDAIEVAPDTLVAARVVEHEAARQQSYDEVRADIEQTLRREAAVRRATEAGEAMLAKLKKGGATEVRWSAPRMVSRRDAAGTDPAVVRTAMGLDASQPPVYFGELRPNEGYALYRVSKVVEAEPRAEDELRETVERLRRRASATQYGSYIASLREGADVSINRENFAKPQ
ncbi:MAG: SurA N-terminal domain-containing protein [Burkholderiales bacterium]|nr:SurA N-terminal domain-containing protein [Burkholderiales bacterium]